MGRKQHWLTQNGFLNRDHYLSQLRLIKRPLLSMVSSGIAEEVDKSECSPRAMPHYHDYKVKPEYLNKIMFRITADPNPDASLVQRLVYDIEDYRGWKNLETREIPIDEVSLGHPCGAVLLYKDLPERQGPLNMDIPLFMFKNVELLVRK